MNKSVYIIGDVHGCFDTFKALVAKLPEDAKICIAGDLIDRGPKSRQLLDYVIENKIDCVIGNHEIFMIEEYHKTLNFMMHTGMLPMGHRGSMWTVNGGYETLESYTSYDEDNVDDRGVPQMNFDYDSFEKHFEFMKKLPTYIEYPEIKNEDGRHLVVSHSLLHNVWRYRNSKDLNKQNLFKKTATWTRNFSAIKDNKDIYNVIGHTPQDNGPKITKIYANVDTGCCYKQYPKNGILTALKFPEMEVITQKNIEKNEGKLI